MSLKFNELSIAIELLQSQMCFLSDLQAVLTCFV
jgi:hypothetical protein